MRASELSWRDTHRGAGIRSWLPVLALLLLLVATACNDAHRGVTSPTTRPVRLNVAASAVLAAEATMVVRVTYPRRDGSSVQLGRQVVTLVPGSGTSSGTSADNTQSISITIDIGACLSDADRVLDAGAGGCPVQVEVQLLRGTTVLDELQRTVTLVPGEDATVAEAISLHEVDAFSAAFTGPVLPVGTAPDDLRAEVGQQLTVSAVARDRTGAEVPGRTVLWSTTTPEIIRLSGTSGSTITLDILRAGRAEIRATTGDRVTMLTLDGLPESARSVQVHPADTTVFVGDTVRFTAEARGASGALIPGAPFQFSSSTNSASITAQGLAVARSIDQVNVRATTSGQGGAALVGQGILRIVARPGLVVNPGSVELITEAGQPLPSRTVSLAGSGAVVGGLTAEVLGAAPVRVVFTSLTTPSTLTVTATGIVPAGTPQSGVVRLRSTTPGVLPVDIPVSVAGAAPAPVLVSRSNVDFGTVDSGTVVAPTAVPVTTTAGRVLTGVTASVEYTSGPSTGWLVAELEGVGAASTLRLQPRMQGLRSGSYTATVTVGAAGGAIPATVTVRLVVRGVGELRATPASVDFGTVDSGTVSLARTVALDARDGRSVSALATSTTYEGGTTVGWLTANLAGSSTSPALQLTANATGLRPGSYEATVTVTAAQPAGTLPVRIPVTVTVQGGDSLVLSREVIDFGTLPAGVTSAPETFTVTTLQGRSVALASELVAQFSPGAPTSWLNRSLSGSLTTPGTGTVSVATAGLQPGTYTAVITVRSSTAGVKPTRLTVRVTVLAIRRLVVLDTIVTFGPLPRQTVSSARAVRILHGDTAGGPITGLTRSISYRAGEPGGWLVATFDRLTTDATLTFQATTGGLPDGTYTATVTVGSTNVGVVSRNVTVRLVVGPQRAFYFATLDSTARVTFGGGNFCSYSALLADVTVEMEFLVDANGGRTLDNTTLRGRYVESPRDECRFPPHAQTILAFTGRGRGQPVVAPAGPPTFLLTLVQSEGQPRATGTIRYSLPTGAAGPQGGLFTIRRTDQEAPLNWTITGNVVFRPGRVP